MFIVWFAYFSFDSLESIHLCIFIKEIIKLKVSPKQQGAKSKIKSELYADFFIFMQRKRRNDWSTHSESRKRRTKRIKKINTLSSFNFIGATGVSYLHDKRKRVRNRARKWQTYTEKTDNWHTRKKWNIKEPEWKIIALLKHTVHSMTMAMTTTMISSSFYFLFDIFIVPLSYSLYFSLLLFFIWFSPFYVLIWSTFLKQIKNLHRKKKNHIDRFNQLFFDYAWEIKSSLFSPHTNYQKSIFAS